MSKRLLYAGIVLTLSIGAPSAYAHREVGNSLTLRHHQSQTIVNGGYSLAVPFQEAEARGPKRNKRGKVRRNVERSLSWQKARLRKLRERANYLELVMHIPVRDKLPGNERTLSSMRNESERYSLLITGWSSYTGQLWQRFRQPPLHREFLCIHAGPPFGAAWGHGEGAWNSVTPAGTDIFYGGLQMDEGFMQRYGSFLLKMKGNANKWTPLEQIWTAVYAVRGPDHRGFYPWPNTARACGLL